MSKRDAAEFEEGKITVAVRCRPFNEREKDLKSSQCLLFAPNGQTLTIFEKGVPNPNIPESEQVKGNPFTFDHAYGMKTAQEQIYMDVGRPVMLASFQGFNTCIFAYGQTGSGKSFCMMGPTGPNAKPELRGITPRLCLDLFEEAKSRSEEAKQKNENAANDGVPPSDRPPLIQFIVEVSYLEIYQETVKCLLNPKKDKLKVRQHPVTGVYVENLTELAVHNFEKVLDLVESGNSVRQVAATNMNDQSSRSHAIFSIILTQKRTSITKDGSEMVSEIKAKINLVDLAGSERAKSTGAGGDTLKEGAQINKSLTTLGLVISGLAEASKKVSGGKAPFIPYRDSMLTWLLKESLGGNSKTFMVSTLSPATVNYDETMSTLRYADRAKSIVTRACVNENAGDKKIRELEEEINKLREYIKQIVASPVPTTPFPAAELIENDAEEQTQILEETSCLSFTQLQERLEQATDLIAKEQLSSEEREIQQQSELAAIEADIQRRRSIKAPKQEPYLLNLDNIGDWVAETLSDEVTYMGTEELEEPVIGARVIVLQGSDEDLDGVGPQHCCFIRNLDSGSIALRPLEGWNTYLENSDEPLQEEIKVSNGQIIHLGESFISFKLIEPTVAPVTARNRKAMLTSRKSALDDSLTPATTVASSSSNPSVPSPPPTPSAIVPILNLEVKSPTALPTVPSVTPSQPTAKTPRLSAIQGLGTDFVENIYRHTFIFVGKTNSGKSAARASLSKEDKWFPFFKREVPTTKPTFGVERSNIKACGVIGKTDLALVELSGNSSFSLLQQLLPERRVTFVVCFRLTDDNCSLNNFKSILEYILCQSASNETRVVLLGTCTDVSKLDGATITAVVANLTNEVTRFFKTRQQRTELCPQVVAKFAISNKDRSVVPVGGNASISKVSDLVGWMADYAIQRCKSDRDFPNAAIPSRAMRLALRLSALRDEGIWCMPSHEYKKVAREIDPAYEKATEILQQHTQLLHSWSLIHHHYRHLHLRKTIILDVPWVTRVLAAISCCIPNPQYSRSIEAIAATKKKSEDLLKFSLLSTEIVQLGDSLPFFLSEVRQQDPNGHATLGILSLTLLKTLFRRLITEKKYDPNDIEPVLELLESYDILIRGSRIGVSHQISVPSDSTIVDDACTPIIEDEDEEPLESYYLMPACFVGQPPISLTIHLPLMLFGPHYKFQMNMVPPHFFARFVSRVSRYAQRIFLGPLHLEGDAPIYNESSQVAFSNLWGNCAWIISSHESRALARMVNNSLFISFHDYANDEVFHEGLRDVVHCLVAENPGAECQEQILCKMELTDDEEIWVQKSENLNSLERILEREQQALRTARGQAPPAMESDMPDNGPIPLLRANDAPFDMKNVLSALVADSMFDNETLHRIEHALHLISRGRLHENVEVGVTLETRGFDLLVDSLANS